MLYIQEPHEELMQILCYLKGDRSRDVSNEENAPTDAIVNQQHSEVSSETTAHTDENDVSFLIQIVMVEAYAYEHVLYAQIACMV